MSIFLKRYWRELTKNMRPWLKYSWGILLFALCVALLPFILVGTVAYLLICLAWIRIKRLIKKRLAPLFFKVPS